MRLLVSIVHWCWRSAAPLDVHYFTQVLLTMTNYMFRIRSLVLASFLLLAAAGSASAQSVDKIVDQMTDEYTQWVANLEDLTTVATVEGSVVPIDSVITYQRKISSSGTPRFETRSKMLGGMTDMFSNDQSSAKLDLLSNYHKIFNLLRKEAKLQGTETINGEEVFVLAVENMRSFYREVLAPAVSNPNMEVDPKNGQFYIDTDESVIRRISLDLSIARGGEPQTVEAVTTLSDYRTVNGLAYPFRVETVMSNMLSPAEKQKMKQRVKELQQQMESMPEERREQMQAMLGPQIRRMKAMSDGSMNVAFVVQDLKVNAGRPEIFNK